MSARDRGSARIAGRGVGAVATGRSAARGRRVRGAGDRAWCRPLGWIVLAVPSSRSRSRGRSAGSEFAFLGLTLLAALLVSIAFVFGRVALPGRASSCSPRRVVAGERALGRLVVDQHGRRPLLAALAARAARRRGRRRVRRAGAGAGRRARGALRRADQPARRHHRRTRRVGARRPARPAAPHRAVDRPGRAVRASAHGAARSRRRPGLVRDLEGEVTKTITNNDISFHALRAVRARRRRCGTCTGARRRAPASSWCGSSRRRGARSSSSCSSTEREHYASDDEFELAVSVIASIGGAGHPRRHPASPW